MHDARTKTFYTLANRVSLAKQASWVTIEYQPFHYVTIRIPAFIKDVDWLRVLNDC